MELEVFSDMVCPWCLLGKRRLESALETYADRDEIRVVWRSFQLRPDDATVPTRTIPELMLEWARGPEEIDERLDLLERLAATEGLEYHLRTARPVNTYDAHRLTHFATEHGAAEAFVEGVMVGYTRDNVTLTDRDSLAGIAGGAGLDEVETRRVLADDSYGDNVRADLHRARELGVSGVPTFVVEGRVGVSGAQSVEVFHALFDRARVANASTGN